MDERTVREKRHREGRCVACGHWLHEDGHVYTTVGGFLLILAAGACVGALLTLGLIALLDWLMPPGIVA